MNCRLFISGVALLVALLATSCSSNFYLSSRYTFEKVRLGMTKEEVYKNTSLRPIKFAKVLDKDGSEIETMYFKTSLVEDPLLGRNVRIYANQVLQFRNGRLISILQEPEQVVTPYHVNGAPVVSASVSLE